MQKLYQDCEECGAYNISIFSNCTPEQMDKITASKTCSHYKKGQHIFYVDNIPLGVYCICKGIVKLVKTNNDGKEQILRFAQQGEFLGYRALIADEPLVSTAICIEDTIACFIPRKQFIEIMDENSSVSKHLLKSLSHELGVVEERVQSMAQKSVRERVAETLLFLHATFKSDSKQDDSVISITLPREDIANIVGTATETVIRLLSEFKTVKLIAFEGKKIKILNKAGLEKISNASL
ncbi:MAG: Crp/Fnr family transcriptional regulator [Bacteroidota bacterium]